MAIGAQFNCFADARNVLSSVEEKADQIVAGLREMGHADADAEDLVYRAFLQQAVRVLYAAVVKGEVA